MFVFLEDDKLSTAFQVVASAIVDKYIGESARVVREMFGYAKDHQPCVIFMDEVMSKLHSEINSSRTVVFPNSSNSLFTAFFCFVETNLAEKKYTAGKFGQNAHKGKSWATVIGIIAKCAKASRRLC